jgi:hypothetical protein
LFLYFSSLFWIFNLFFFTRQKRPHLFFPCLFYCHKIISSTNTNIDWQHSHL